MKRLLPLVLCALFALDAGARTFYVDASRPNNGGNGRSAATAKKTIQAAINLAKKGDTVLVLPGTYSPIRTNGKKIVVKSVRGRARTTVVRPKTPTVVSGVGAAHVVLAQMGKPHKEYYIPTSGIYRGVRRSHTVFSDSKASTVAGFTLDGRNWEAATIGASAGKLKSCEVTRIGGPCVSSDYDSSWAIRWSTVVGCAFTQCIIYSDAMFANCRLNRCIVRNNTLWEADLAYNTTFANTLVVLNDCDFGWSVGSCNKFLNCTIADNAMEFKVAFAPHKSRFVNCILRNNYRYLSRYAGALIRSYSRHSFVRTAKTNRNPKFASGYKLAPGSYCIDTGKLTKKERKLVGKKDLAGKKRIQGKAIDRGCYEY